MPVSKKRSALEEAEWEDDPDEQRAFDREMMLQSRCLWPNFSLIVANVASYSDGEVACVPPSGCILWVSWDGANLCGCRGSSSPGGISCSNTGPWRSVGRFGQGMQCTSHSLNQRLPLADCGGRHRSNLRRGQTSPAFGDLHSFACGLVCYGLGNLEVHRQGHARLTIPFRPGTTPCRG